MTVRGVRVSPRSRGCTGGAPRGVECLGVDPSEAKGLTHFGVAQPVNRKTMAARIGKWDIRAAGAGKFRVKFDAVADIDHDEQRGTALTGWQRTGVLLGLALSLEHGFVPKGRYRVWQCLFLRPSLWLYQLRIELPPARVSRHLVWLPGQNTRAYTGRYDPCWSNHPHG